MNKNIFGSKPKENVKTVVNTVNNAGGVAYKLEDKQALAQLALVGTLNQTFYMKAETQLDNLLKYAKNCDDEYVAKVAVYAREHGFMKDTPVILLTYLLDKGSPVANSIFNKVVNNVKQLRTFTQMVRSGKLGKKYFTSRAKTLVKNWLNNKDADILFKQSVGDSPSLGDVIKLCHVKAKDDEHQETFRWLLGKEFNFEKLPTTLKEFQQFKAMPTYNVPPAIDFRFLSNIKMTESQWQAYSRDMPWNVLRMNLNQLAKKGVFKDSETTTFLAQKLASREEVEKTKVFPYEILTAYQNLDSDVPYIMRVALENAMEFATKNIPVVDGNVAVCVDVSGSMSSAIAAGKTRAIDVAALVGASVLRKNPNATIIPFENNVVDIEFKDNASIMENSKALSSIGGGGTNCSSALQRLLDTNWKGNLVIFVSDNESWLDNSTTSIYFNKTKMSETWNQLKQRNKKCKLVCIDITPNTTTQVPNTPDVLNIGGFSDSVWTVINDFVNTGENLVEQIEKS